MCGIELSGKRIVKDAGKWARTELLKESIAARDRSSRWKVLGKRSSAEDP